MIKPFLSKLSNSIFGNKSSIRIFEKLSRSRAFTVLPHGINQLLDIK